MAHLTPGQRQFAGLLSGLTPLLPRVVGAWCLSEMSGGAADGRQRDGNHNWLNIAYFDSGPGSITRNSAWRSPETAAEATNDFLRGKRFSASAGIRAILRKADGQGPMQQINAICTSGWATNPAYCQLIRGTFRLLADENIPQLGPGESATSGGPGGGSFTTRNRPYTFEVGSGEDYWEAAGRLADEVEWALFLDGRVVYYDPEPELLKQEPVTTIRRSAPSTLDFSMNWDRRNIATDMSVRVVCRPFAFRAGQTVQLAGFGPASVASAGKPEYPGRWLIAEIKRNRFEPFSELTLKQPTRPNAEPAPETVRSPTSQGPGPNGNPSPQGTGNWAWPVSPHPVSSDFGPRVAPTPGASSYHEGIDISVGRGTIVRAADNGKVTVAGVNGGYGNYVEIDHGGGLHSYYAHLMRWGVKVGQVVQKGERIGLVDSTGTSTGDHLHFGASKGGTAVDPMNYL
jgi:hypothetical protein